MQSPLRILIYHKIRVKHINNSYLRFKSSTNNKHLWIHAQNEYLRVVYFNSVFTNFMIFSNLKQTAYFVFGISDKMLRNLNTFPNKLQVESLNEK